MPVPYREPLFERLHERGRLETHVVYLAGIQPGWDQRGDWFPESHPYPAEALASCQRRRAGRSPVTVPRGLGRALASLDPACVVSWEYGPATLRALAWRRRGRALVVFSELTRAAARELSPLQRGMHRLLAPRVDGFVAASSAARERLTGELGADPERVQVSLQSADLERLRGIASGRSHEGPVRVTCVARLVRDKNLGRLIEAFAEAGAAGAGAELELCGTGPLEHELRAAAERAGVAVRFRGYAAPAELPDVYAGADVLALVSEYEPFGVALREGAAAGLPLVCTRAAGAAGDIAREGENAFLVDPRDGGQIADALRRLIEDAGLRRRMCEASVAITEATPLEADAEAFEHAVLAAIERRR